MDLPRPDVSYRAQAIDLRAVMARLNLFISYAHEDESLCKELLAHMSQLRRNGLEGWYDRRITAGSEWEGAIDEHLNIADIILLLISKDFLASDYCYDVEMKRALERHENREARVIPIILRPADWKTSPFSKLNALPKDGKPVVDWQSRDHGFLNVVEGLRRVTEELAHQTGKEPVSTSAAKLSFKPLPGVRPWQYVALALAAVVLFGACFLWWSAQRKYLAEGNAYLDVGRYSDARQAFQKALQRNPLSTSASRGLEIVQLADLRSDAVAFERKLKQISSGSGYLKVLRGDLLLGQHQLDEALAEYREAVRLNPQLAEGYYRLGVLYSMRRDSKRSLDMYKQAVDLAPGSSHYRNNLASAYFKRGEYEKAISEYEKIDRFPSAALEMANIYRLLGRVDEAVEKERIAIEWLENNSIMAVSENRLPWILELNQNQRVSIPSRSQKLCYALWELSATVYLKGGEAEAREIASRAAQACGKQSLDVKTALRGELQRLADEQDQLAPRIVLYRQHFL